MFRFIHLIDNYVLLAEGPPAVKQTISTIIEFSMSCQEKPNLVGDCLFRDSIQLGMGAYCMFFYDKSHECIGKLV